MAGNRWRTQPRDGKGRWTDRGTGSVRSTARAATSAAKAATASVSGPRIQASINGVHTTVSREEAARIMFGSAGSPSRAVAGRKVGANKKRRR